MLNTIFTLIWERKYTFLGAFFVVFFFTYLLLVAIDLIPEAPAIEVEDSTTVEAIDTTVAPIGGVRVDFETGVNQSPEAVFPNSISIKKLDRVIPVLNPTSRAIDDLDNALLNGVVRHPDSAHLAQDGNVFILGHSSYLPSVVNSNFQAFNGIQKLEWGDIIEVSSDSHVYVYEVEKVFKARAQDVTVPIAGDSPRLVLATCNSFGSTDDRFIVEARQISVRAL